MYDLDNAEYFSTQRDDILNLLKGQEYKSALEIGSGSGATLVEIKKRSIANEVWGIEQFSFPDSYQQSPEINHFHISTLEEALPKLPTNYFDLLILADVLEHMTDPWQVLKDLRPHLASDCRIVVSLPNIRHFSIFYKVFIKGSFEYSPKGVLDRTHLRFFCKKDMINLLEDADLKVELVKPSYELAKRNKARYLNVLTARIFEEFITKQFILLAKKN